jgi:hypothetical protein
LLGVGPGAPAGGFASSSGAESGADVLDLLGGVAAGPAPGAAVGSTSPVAAAAGGSWSPIVAFDKAGVTVKFAFSKPVPSEPSVTLVTATSTNSTPVNLSDFTLQVREA